MDEFPLFGLTRTEFDALTASVIKKCNTVEQWKDLRQYIQTGSLIWKVYMSCLALKQHDQDVEYLATLAQQYQERRKAEELIEDCSSPKVPKLAEQEIMSFNNSEEGGFENHQHWNSIRVKRPRKDCQLTVKPAPESVQQSHVPSPNDSPELNLAQSVTSQFSNVGNNLEPAELQQD